MIEAIFALRAACPNIAIAAVRRMAVVEIENDPWERSALRLPDSAGVPVRTRKKGQLPLNDRVQQKQPPDTLVAKTLAPHFGLTKLVLKRALGHLCRQLLLFFVGLITPRIA